MTTWPHQDAASMNAFYGAPDPDHDGVPNRSWEDANLVSIIPPYDMVLAWDVAKPVKSIRCHRMIAQSLTWVLGEIQDHYKTQHNLEAAGMHLYGGCFNYRLMRGSTQLSIHSWGAAIDLDPAHNVLGSHQFSMPKAVVEIFDMAGWVWGGTWHRPDAQHFQAARI